MKTVKKAEWLKLLVPKNNLHFASLVGGENFRVSSDAGSDDNDSSLIELWCKVVNVKALQAGF